MTYWLSLSTLHGCKELVRVKDAYQELESNWTNFINDLRARDLTVFPRA